MLTDVHTEFFIILCLTYINNVIFFFNRDILANYGTAVDAAIATLICNGVRTPHSMGIGGGMLDTWSFSILYQVISFAERKINFQPLKVNCIL